MVVLNRPGASGSIGWSYVAGSDDGYRLILMTPEMLVVPLMGIGKVTVGDFQPIARFTDDPSSITVRADAPWRTAQEFIQYAKANPGKVTFSNAGNGTIPHVAAGAFAETIGAQLEHIPTRLRAGHHGLPATCKPPPWPMQNCASTLKAASCARWR